MLRNHTGLLPAFLKGISAGKMIDLGEINASGPGLSSGTINHNNQFQVVNATEIAVDITGPSRAEIIIDALPPSSEETGFSIEYRVTSPGDYLITINDKGKAIPGSPFKTVIHDGDAKKNVGDHTRVKVVGPGMVTGLVGKPARFYVDSQHAGGGGKLNLRLVGAAKAQLREVEPGYGFEYIPAAPGKHLIYITFNDYPIPNSPFTVNIKEDPERKEPYGYPSKIVLDGDGLHGGSVSKPVWFDVLMAEAGAGELRVDVTGPDQGTIRDGIVGITNDPRNCSARVAFEPLRSGSYKVEVKFANENVPRSPFVVYVN